MFDPRILPFVRASFPTALAVYVFGSRVAGTFDAESDLDVAVLVEGYADPLQLWDLSAGLAGLLNCPVDVLDLRAASTVMQYQVITRGQRLWAKDSAADLFESYVLSEKTALEEARAGRLQDILQRGRVYGG